MKDEQGKDSTDVKVYVIEEGTVIANSSAHMPVKEEGERHLETKQFSPKGKRAALVSRRSWIENKLLMIILFVIWGAINIFFFYKTYTDTCESPSFYYMKMILKESLCVAKGAAYVININCALILFPMCRGILVRLRTYFSEHLHGYFRRLFDHAKGYHIYCAYSIVFFSLMHTVAHLINNYNYMQNFSETHPELNLVDSKEDMEYYVIFGTVPGVTGVLLLLILLYMYATSIKRFRVLKFEMFWYTHHMYVLFFALTMAHGFNGVLRYQTNTDEHIPGCDSTRKGINGTVIHSCSEEAKFARQTPTSWKWIIGPLVIFLIDKIVRIYQRQGFVEIKKIVLHEGHVMEIHMLKDGFCAQPGQYIRIKCPDIAKFEWHPFTLTKCPSEVDEEFWVQIKVVGEWTEAMSSQLSSVALKQDARTRVGNSCFVDLEATSSRDEKGKSVRKKPLRIKVEGPFGGPMQDVTNYKTGICVGAGIGVTPFTAVLNSLRDRTRIGSSGLGKLKRIYFIWVCRKVEDFSWCLNILYDAYLQFEESNKGLLVYKLFVTRASEISDEDTFLVGEKQKWLKSILQYGRPKWNKELHSISENHQRESIGVFFCGPKVAGSDLDAACLKERSNENVFIYHKETLG